MITGITKNGFEFSIPEENLNNMETLDALSEVDSGNIAAISRASLLLLGKETKERLYDFLRTEKGNVPIEAFAKEILEITELAGKQGKNL